MLSDGSDVQSKWSLKVPVECMQDHGGHSPTWNAETSDIDTIFSALEDVCKRIGNTKILEDLAKFQEKDNDVHNIDMLPDQGVALLNVVRTVLSPKKDSRQIPHDIKNGPIFFIIRDHVEGVVSFTDMEPIKFQSAAICVLHSKDHTDKEHIFNKCMLLQCISRSR